MLRIGPITLPHPVVQAALSGYSDLAMRRVARHHGARYALHEVVLDRLVLTPGKERRRIFAVPDDDHPVGGQLMGSQPEGFGEAAAELVDGGFDVVDLNFGCPVSKVLGRCRGGFLLSQPETALAIVDAVLDAVGNRVPVTVKMRRGLDDTPESERAFFRILDGAYERGVAAITVHGRTVRQRYEGPSDWAFLARVKSHIGDRTLLGSGDLFDAHAVKAMLEQTGVDGVTLARGCIGNPFLFRQVEDVLAGRTPQPPDLAAQRAAIDLHWRYALELWGEERAVGKTRRHAIQYASLHPNPIAVRDAFVAVKKAAHLRAVLERHYAAATVRRVDRPLTPKDRVRLSR